MSQPSPLPRLDTPLRRWIPDFGSAAILSALFLLVGLLRAAVVVPKALSKAREHWKAVQNHLPDASFKWEDAAVLGTHLSTLAALAVLGLALITMRWWHPSRPLAPAAPPADQPAPTRWFLPGLGALLLLAALLRLPLAAGSLWWDELWNIKFATIGEWRQDKANPENATFLPSSWPRAAWYYNKPTNHPILTLPSKACHEIWQGLTHPKDPGAFKEIVIRLPVLLAGLGAICLTAFLTRRLAGPGAGLVAAAIMALHPWLLRYGVDARGYGMAVCFMALALFSLERALSGTTQRTNLWWWTCGACQFFLMWAHVLANLAICAALFTTALCLISFGKGPDKGRQVARLVCLNLVAACLLLTAFLPNLLQAMTWGGRNDDGNLLTGSYFLRTLCQITAGMDPPPGAGTPGIPYLRWWGLGLLAGFGIVAAGTGLRQLFRTHGKLGWVPPGVLLGATGFLLVVKATDFYFYHRFVLPAIVPLILLVAIGISRWRSCWLTGLAFFAFIFLTFPQNRLLLTRSYAPFREVAAAMSLTAKSSKAPPLFAAYGLGSHVMQPYLPGLRDIRTNPGPVLQDLINQARQENRPLLLALGYEELNRLNLPDGFRLIDDPALFRKTGTWHGIEPEFTFHLFELQRPEPPVSP